ncbi:MAG: hypothetical protein KDB80_16995 [Planctomycetes bacterium]|nr:hypothetical protein [Planctomycetota bacterium]
MTTLHRFCAAFALLSCLVVGAKAQGIEVKADATVLFGSTATCTKPASVEWKKVRKTTPEWQTIKSEGVKKGTARYSLLISEMTQRLKRLAKSVAQTHGFDCVVCEDDIDDEKGLDVEDVTKRIIKLLESEADEA